MTGRSVIMRRLPRGSQRNEADMSLFQDQDQRSSGPLPGDGATCAPPPARGRGGGRLAAALGLGAARVPGSALSWYRTGTEAVVFLVIVAAGYGLEQAVAARTGRRVLR